MADETIYTMAGTRIYIGDKPMPSKTEVTPSDFNNVNWTEIGGLYNVGELGGEQTFNTFELINSEWVQISKGGRDGGTMTNQFVPLALDSGQQKVLEAVDDKCGKYPIKVERGADCAPTATVTFSIAAPGTVSWTGSNFAAGQPVVFTNDGGALPDGLTAGTVYYVISAGLSADQFSVSATAGGSGIEFEDAGSGTSTGTAPPAGMTDLFQAAVGDGARSGGGKNDGYFRTWAFRVNGRIITI